jgi:3-hydroxymyristoyl/3-hydroxydecanoyl-(acyl carrier protein) dehydratase
MSNLKNDAASALLELTSPRMGEVEAVLLFQSGLTVFKGHFPGHPLVPGILEIEAVRTVVERSLGARLRILSVVKAKFLREIGPDEKIELTAKFTGEKKELTVDGTLWIASEKAAQIQLTMVEDE